MKIKKKIKSLSVQGPAPWGGSHGENFCKLRNSFMSEDRRELQNLREEHNRRFLEGKMKRIHHRVCF